MRPARRRLGLGVWMGVALALLLWIHHGHRPTPHPVASAGEPTATAAPTAASSIPPCPGSWSDRCVGVSDGDTIAVMHSGTAVKVRLNGVDCPERDQAFGSVARRFTSEMVFRHTVIVNPHDTDRYGRTVADIYDPDGSSLNYALVAAGLAWWYRQYAPGDTGLETLEREARQARRGLWADANPLPPWEFRRMARPAGRRGR